MNNVYLVGFMGTGKTTVGKELSARLKSQFVDLDDLIELREKRVIADIFAQDGEQYFRCVETRLLKEVALTSRGFVVACGGGIVVRPENIKAMKESGSLICLRASPGVILQRTRGAHKRPLLNVPNPRERIQELLEARQAYYDQADKIIDTSFLNIEEVVAQIQDFLAIP